MGSNETTGDGEERKRGAHPYVFFRRPFTTMGRGWRKHLLRTLTMSEQSTAPEAKYATPADRVYRTKAAVTPVTIAFVWGERMSARGGGSRRARTCLVEQI